MTHGVSKLENTVNGVCTLKKQQNDSLIQTVTLTWWHPSSGHDIVGNLRVDASIWTRRLSQRCGAVLSSRNVSFRNRTACCSAKTHRARDLNRSLKTAAPNRFLLTYPIRSERIVTVPRLKKTILYSHMCYHSMITHTFIKSMNSKQLNGKFIINMMQLEG